MKAFFKVTRHLLLTSLLTSGAALAAGPSMPAISGAAVDGPYLVISVFGEAGSNRTNVQTFDDAHMYPPITNSARVTRQRGANGSHVFKVQLLNQRNKPIGKILLVEFDSLERDPVHCDLVDRNGYVRTLECSILRDVYPCPAASKSN